MWEQGDQQQKGQEATDAPGELPTGALAEEQSDPPAGTVGERGPLGEAPPPEDEEDDPDSSALLERLAMEQPRSWASMARGLSQGGGQLGPSKVQGYAYPAAYEAPGGSYPPLGGSSQQQSSAQASTQPQQPARGGRGGAGRPPASTTATPAYSSVWLWVSRIPTDPLVETQELLDCINGYTEGLGRAVEVDRQDSGQPWLGLSVSTQEAADAIVLLSKERKLLLRGRLLRAEPHRTNSNYSSSGRRTRGAGGGGGGGKGRDAEQRPDGAEGRGSGGAKAWRRPRGGNSAADGRERPRSAASQGYSSPTSESGTRQRWQPHK